MDAARRAMPRARSRTRFKSVPVQAGALRFRRLLNRAPGGEYMGKTGARGEPFRGPAPDRRRRRGGAQNAGVGRGFQAQLFDPDGTRAHATHATAGSNCAGDLARVRRRASRNTTRCVPAESAPPRWCAERGSRRDVRAALRSRRHPRPRAPNEGGLELCERGRRLGRGRAKPLARTEKQSRSNQTTRGDLHFLQANLRQVCNGALPLAKRHRFNRSANRCCGRRPPGVPH